jgi:hypothetical protein
VLHFNLYLNCCKSGRKLYTTLRSCWCYTTPNVHTLTEDKTNDTYVGGRYQCANTSPTLIVRLWIYTLNTFCPGIPRWTQRSPNCTRCACCCETGVASAGFPWWWKSPEVNWSRPRCQSAEAESSGPLTAASHTLPERRAWALAWSHEAKPPCGSFPTHSIQFRWGLCDIFWDTMLCSPLKVN